MNKKGRRRDDLTDAVSRFNRETEEEIPLRNLFFVSSSLAYAGEKLQYSFDVSVALLYETLEEGDGDVTYSLVVVHRQSYDESCTLSLRG